MFKNCKPTAIFLIFICQFSLFAPQGFAEQSPPARVQEALDELHQWLGSGENGTKWRQYLRSEQLTELLSSDEAPDRIVLSAILDRYRSDAQGLDLPRFSAVRQALEQWQAALPPIPLDELAAAAIAAKANYHPLTQQDAARKKDALMAAAEELEQYLARGGPDYEKAWKSYLKWEDFEKAMASDEKADLRLLPGMQERFFRDQPGVEFPRWLTMRQALKDYIAAEQFLLTPNAEAVYAQLLDGLATDLRAFAESPESDLAVKIGETIGNLERFGLASDLVAAVRHHGWKPNIFLRVSERFLKAGIEGEVDEQTQVQETILGTSVYGDAHLTGNVLFDVVPNTDQASLMVQLKGTTHSNNVGYNGPVTIYSTGVTDVDANKTVYISDLGFTGDPAEATCWTSTSINGIGASGNLIRKIAWSRALGSKRQAEREASVKAARRIAARVDDRVAEMIDKGNDYYGNKFRKRLIRRDGFPQDLDFSTSEDALLVEAIQASGRQLAAFGPPPPIEGDPAISARVHETLVANFSEAYIGGETMTDVQLAEMLEELTGNVPDELKIDDDKDPWSITFADERPITARFGDNRVQIFLRGKQLTRGENPPQRVRKLVEIAAEYDITKTDAGATLDRVGDVVVRYLSRESEGVPDIVMKTFIKVKFEALFKQKIERSGIKLGGRWEKVGKLTLGQLQCGDGWLALGWQQPDSATRVANRGEQ